MHPISHYSQITAHSQSTSAASGARSRLTPAMKATLEALADRLSSVAGFLPGQTKQRLTKATLIREAMLIGVQDLTDLADGAN